MSSVVNIVVTATNRTAGVFRAIERQLSRGISAMQAHFVRLTGSSNSFVRALGQIGNAGGAAAQAFIKSFTPVMMSGLASVAAMGASLLIAALGSAVLLAVGGAAFGLGIALAAKSPPVKAAFDEFKDRAKKAFKDLSGPFQAPMVRALNAAGATAEKIGPSIFKMVAMAAPHLDQLSLGFLQLVERAMPGLEKAVEAAMPLFDKLGEKMPEIGTALSQFFTLLADAGPELTRVFALVIDALNVLIVVLGGTINFAAKFYSTMIDFWLGVAAVAVSAWNAIKGAAEAAWNFIKDGVSGLKGLVISAFRGLTEAILGFFGTIINGAAKIFSWVPGIGPQLQKAAAEFNNFKNQVNAALAAIDKHVVITIERKFIGGTLGGAGGYRGLASGGIVGAASGGSRSRLTMVGEHGRELVDFSQGRVYNHGQTERMMKGSGGPSSIHISVAADSSAVGNPLVNAVLQLIRDNKIRLNVSGSRVVAA